MILNKLKKIIKNLNKRIWTKMKRKREEKIKKTTVDNFIIKNLKNKKIKLEKNRIKKNKLE